MTLMKETEEYTNDWKDVSCSWIGGINGINMFIQHKAIYRLNAFPLKIPMAIFIEIEQMIIKLS